MKTTTLIKRTAPLFMLIAFLFSATAIAQTTVKAEDIMRDIKNGKDVSYENVTITGVLDMTFMEDKLPDLPKKRRWYNGSNAV